MSETPNVPARPVLPSEAERMVSLREFEQRLQALLEQLTNRIRAERELVETRSTALEKALDLQSKEYARRLEELNHSHQHAIENWRTSLPREIFDAATTEWSRWRDLVNGHMVTMASVPQELASIETRLKLIETQGTSHLVQVRADLNALASRVQNVEQLISQGQGAMTLVRFMGFAGVVALLVTFARMARLIP